MDSFEWNKIAGAVLFALLLSVGLSIFSEVLFEAEEPETPGYVIAVATEEGSEAGASAEAQPIAMLLAAADPKAGENSAKKCAACHTFASGDPNKVGPNLWSAVNRPIAAHEGYEYSDAMRAYADTAKTWTFDNLNTYLHNPKGTVPGTKMAFAGLKDDAERANVIAYLRTLSDNPAPLPEAAAADALAAGTEVAAVESQGAATDAAPAAEAPAAEAPAATTPAAPAEAPAVAEAPATVSPAQNESAAPAETPAATAEAAATEAPAPAEQPAAPEQQTAQAETHAAAPAPATAAAGDPAKGETFAARCKACHTFEKGGPNRVGSNLFSVVGRPIASVPDFNYSEAMKTFAAGGKVWDDATLHAYLADPKGSIPGNKMAFPGVKSEADRANVIAYLKTLVE